MKIAGFDTEKLFEPVSPASLGVFRILFGLMMIWQLTRLQTYVLEGLVHSKYFVTYDFFEWVQIGSPEVMSALFVLLYLAAGLILAGIFYRPAMVVYFLGWTYLFLLDRGHYNNHYYLFCLLSFLMIFLSADRAFSLRNLIKKKGWTGEAIPFWNYLNLKLMVLIVYFYGGIAKIHKDWLEGFPLKMWLPAKGKRFGSGIIHDFLQTDFAAYSFSYGGILFDLCIGFLLWNRKTRLYALPLLIFFHASNAWLWDIGVFPWFMLGATILFFDPDWPEKIAGLKNNSMKSGGASGSVRPIRDLKRKLVVFGFGLFFVWQLLFPLRHYLIGGNPSWHGQADWFSWRMLLVDRADRARMKVSLPGQGTLGYIEFNQYMTYRQFFKMCRRPKEFQKFALFLKDDMQKNGFQGVPQISLTIWRQLNGRPYQLMVDSTANLAGSPYDVWDNHPAYILPFKDTPHKENWDDFLEISEEEAKLMGLQY